MLEISSLRKNFGSLEVLKGIDMVCRAGEIISVVGPNGAGKTTLMRCIADGAERTSGKVVVNHRDILRLQPYRITSFGLGRKFQTANVFDALSVADCLLIAARRGRFPSVFRRSQCLELPEASISVLQASGLINQLGTVAADLGHGLRQALELSMVLALEPNVLLLDEPTAGLTTEERKNVGALLIRLARENGICIIIVEHDFDFVKRISSRMVVLHQGTMLIDGSVEEVSKSEVVRDVYLGDKGRLPK